MPVGSSTTAEKELEIRRLKYRSPVNGAICEIISGISSLHMFADPIEPDPDAMGFISECDGNVKHSLEHLNAAIDILMSYEKHHA